MSKQVLWAVVGVAAVLLLAGLLLSALWAPWLSYECHARVVATVATAFQVAIASMALIIAALWFLTQRLHRVRADLSLSATHQRLTEDKLLLHVTVTVKNLGEVALSPKSGYLIVSKVRPVDDPKLLALLKQWQDNKPPEGHAEVAWPILCSRALWFGESEAELGPWRFEPKESDSYSLDVVVDAAVDLVRISVFLSECSERKRGEVGWRGDILHDLRG